MSTRQRPTKASVLKALRSVHDPELGLDIVSLGLIYGVTISAQSINIRATLTTPGCPLADVIMNDMQRAVTAHAPSFTTHVDLTFDPPWNPSMIDATVRQELGRSSTRLTK